MDFTFKSSYVGRTRGPDAFYCWVPAGTVGHLNTDKKDGAGADLPDDPSDWPTLVPGSTPGADGTYPQVAAPVPDGVTLALDVQAYRIKAPPAGGELGRGQLAASPERATVFVYDHLVTFGGALAPEPARQQQQSGRRD